MQCGCLPALTPHPGSFKQVSGSSEKACGGAAGDGSGPGYFHAGQAVQEILSERLTALTSFSPQPCTSLVPTVHSNMHVCIHTPSVTAGAHTHPALGPASSYYPWESSDLLSSPCLAAWSLWAASHIPGHATTLPAPPPHTHRGCAPRAIKGSGLCNGKSSW